MPILAKGFKQVFKNYDDVMTFGKHRGKTVSWIAKNEPYYIVWLHEENIVKFPDHIVDAAAWDDADNSPPESFFWEPD